MGNASMIAVNELTAPNVELEHDKCVYSAQTVKKNDGADASHVIHRHHCTDPRRYHGS